VAVQESFRINKHSLSMRPIYHFKPQRIQAHILICYIAFALSRFLQRKIKTMSFEKIREELLHVEASIMEDQKSKKCYRIPSAMTEESLEIYKIMGIKRSSRPSVF
jgi:transposase